jgi:hypothetical protein
MKQTFWTLVGLMLSVAAAWPAGVTVNKAGTGDFTSIQEAINSGASLITITDSETYLESLDIGDPIIGGDAVTLTSNQTGNRRPVITPNVTKTYTNSRRANQGAGFGLFANNSVVSNLIIEAQPDLALGAMMIMANNAVVENCLFRISSGTLTTLAAMNPLLFLAQQGNGSNLLDPGNNPTPDGQDCNGCIIRNCEFAGIAPDADPIEPTTERPGYLTQKSSGGSGQGSGYARMDHLSDGRDVFVTFEGCYFHHNLDYGIFPTNGRDGAGSINVIVRGCRFDATGKFQVRGRGANVFVESSVFTRANQARNGDGENSAVAIQTQDGHVPSGSVSNCVFVNCGSANAQRAYYGGVNNHNGTLLTVDQCTFVDCLSGVGAGTGGAGTLSVKNSVFHLIGNNTPPAIGADGGTLTSSSPDVVDGQYAAWTNGLPNYTTTKWSAVFNRFTANDSLIQIDNCLVGTVASEDTRTWEDALAADEVLGCRLFAGAEDDFAGASTVTRGIPIFTNTDPDAPDAFQLASSSPGQGLGAKVAPVLKSKLRISRAGNALTVSWTQPLWVKGYELKSTADLSNPTWTTVPGVVDNKVTLNIAAGNQFYAVMKQ